MAFQAPPHSIGLTGCKEYYEFDELLLTDLLAAAELVRRSVVKLKQRAAVREAQSGVLVDCNQTD